MVLSVAYKRYAFRSSGTRWQETLWWLGTSGLHEGVETYRQAASKKNNPMPASRSGYILPVAPGEMDRNKQSTWSSFLSGGSKHIAPKQFRLKRNYFSATWHVARKKFRFKRNYFSATWHVVRKKFRLKRNYFSATWLKWCSVWPMRDMPSETLELDGGKSSGC